MATAARRRHAGGGGAAAAEWASVSTTGAWRVEPIGKHQLMRRTGLRARDLRALDPALSSYPSSLTGRDRAVVVNLERVRAVITASEVLVPGPRDPAAAPLVSELRARLAASAAASPAPPQSGAGAGKDGGGVSPPGGGGGKVLPFEFRALEVCLEHACKSLEHEVHTGSGWSFNAFTEFMHRKSCSLNNLIGKHCSFISSIRHPCWRKRRTQH